MACRSRDMSWTRSLLACIRSSAPCRRLSPAAVPAQATPSPCKRRTSSGTSIPSIAADIVTTYHVTEIFNEPDTQPNNTIFVGTFQVDSTAGTVSQVQGRLGEAMTGGSSPYPNDTMTWIELDNQLSSEAVTAGSVAGLLVTTFRLTTTNTLSTNPTLGGTDGWAPGTASGRYYGSPGSNAGNAYARIFVNPKDPTAPPSPSAIALLAYADCTPGGMMGSMCMTGTSAATYGTVGTMGGTPSSLVITQ